MNRRPVIPPGVTVYTDQLAGSTLAELLEAGARNTWPNNECDQEWALLRNWAIQAKALLIDREESLAWEQSMLELARRDLPYTEWVAERTEALKTRLRARKLAQANLRYALGYRGHRRWGLIAREVRAIHRATMGAPSPTGPS